jgi:LysR family glycine cleavage system transcriptional activator
MELLLRGRSGLKPAPALAAALSHLGAAFKELDAAAEALDLQRGYEIHVAAVSDFVELWLKPRLGGFRDTHPNILFSINGEGDAPPRLGLIDCEISFGPVREGANNDLLFRDFVIPISSPENTTRIAKLRPRERLEGFPLLHLDFYKDDPGAPNWSDWIKLHRQRRTAPGRGIRFQRITPALEAVLANAGLTICGLALITDLVTTEKVSLPFPVSNGHWSDHVFQARFRNDALARPQVRGFREWLIGEARATEAWLLGRTRSKRENGGKSGKRQRAT